MAAAWDISERRPFMAAACDISERRPFMAATWDIFKRRPSWLPRGTSLNVVSSWLPRVTFLNVVPSLLPRVPSLNVVPSWLPRGTCLNVVPLNAWCETEHVLIDSQCCFRDKRSTVDCALILYSIIQNMLASNQKLYCAFIDYNTWFDSISINNLWIKLVKSKISSIF